MGIRASVIRLSKGGCRLVVSPAGGAVLSAEVGGRPLLVPAATPGLASRLHGREACFPMLPFGNRIGRDEFQLGDRRHRLQPLPGFGDVLHGDGWRSFWHAQAASRTKAVLGLEIVADNRSPYAYSASQTIEALADGLSLTLSVTNRGATALPFGIGFHPYFPNGPETRFRFRSSRVWAEGPGHLPGASHAVTGAFDFSASRPAPADWINNVFDFPEGEVAISDGEGTIMLAADPVFSHLMAYKPDGPAPYFCLEPMSHMPDAHNRSDGGLAMLAPGAGLSGTVTIRLAERHSPG